MASYLRQAGAMGSEMPCVRGGVKARHIRHSIFFPPIPRTKDGPAMPQDLSHVILHVVFSTTGSSDWIKEKDTAFMPFAWQLGHASPSIQYPDLPRLRANIDGQEEHHRKVNLQDEYRGFLIEHGIEFNARYVWD